MVSWYLALGIVFAVTRVILNPETKVYEFLATILAWPGTGLWWLFERSYEL